MIHATAEVEDGAVIGAGTAVWARTHVRRGAVIGADCRIGADVYIGVSVRLGDRCKVQNQALLYEGVVLEAEVFIGPGACLLNDRFPRASTPDGRLKETSDWTSEGIRVRRGASVGGRAVVLPGITVGCHALVGAAAVVTRRTPDHALVVGNPARVIGWVCRCGSRLADGHCRVCGRVYRSCPDGLEETK